MVSWEYMSLLSDYSDLDKIAFNSASPWIVVSHVSFKITTMFEQFYMLNLFTITLYLHKNNKINDIILLYHKQMFRIENITKCT